MLDFAAYCETLGPCEEPADVNFTKALEWVYTRPDFDMQPAKPNTPEEPEWLRAAPVEEESAYSVDAPPRSAPKLKTISADDLLTRAWPEPRWTVPGLVPVGLVLLAGRPKVGKSWLALQLAQAVAVGGRFFGEAIAQGPVLYVALEDGSRRIAKRMKLQGWPVGRGRCDFLHRSDAQELDGLGARAAQRLTQAIEEEGYRLVVIDTLSRLCHGDQNDVGAMTQALGPIQEAATRLDVTVLVVDHHKKSQRDAGATTDPVDDALGSTAKSAVADVLLGLYRDKDLATVHFQKGKLTGRELRVK
jgi:RecA-family ATPase